MSRTTSPTLRSVPLTGRHSSMRMATLYSPPAAGGPSEVSGFLVNGEFVFPGLTSSGKTYVGMGSPLKPRQAPNCRSTRRRRGRGRPGCDPRLVQTRVLGGRIQQLHAVVVARLRVDDEQDRMANGVSTEPTMLSTPRCGWDLPRKARTSQDHRRCACPGSVHLDVSAELTHRQLTCQAVQVVSVSSPHLKNKKAGPPGRRTSCRL